MGTFYENSQMLGDIDLSKVVAKNLRNSSYTISVKLETEEDKYMLLHGYTGVLDVVGGNVVNYLNNVNNPESKNDEVSEATFNTLIRKIFDEKSKKGRNHTFDNEKTHCRKYEWRYFFAF